MEHEYREILLLTGLEEITKKELQRFKYLVMDEFKISRSLLDETTDRPELADLLIQSAGPALAVTKTIHLFQKLNYMHAAKCLQEQKKKGMWKCLSFNDTRAIKPPECCINLLNHLLSVPSPPCLRGTKNCVPFLLPALRAAIHCLQSTCRNCALGMAVLVFKVPLHGT